MAENATPRAQRARRPDTRPAEIMDAAQVLFSSRGFRATSLDQVAEAAGVTKGAIYHYFTGKDDLLLKALNLWMETHWLPSQVIIEGEPGPASAKLRLIIRHIWETTMNPGMMGMIRLLEGELVPEFPEIVEKWNTESVLPAFQVVIDIVEEGKRSGEFRKELDTPVVVRFLVMGLNKLAGMHCQGPDARFRQFSSDRVLDSIIDVLFGGLRNFPRA